MSRSTPVRYVTIRILIFTFGVILSSKPAYALVDDRQITINSAADVTNKRQALINFIWGTDGFPSNKLPSLVQLSVASPVSGLNNLERVDTLTITMDAGQTSYAHHFIPQRKINRLVVLHHGHGCSFNDTQGFTDAGLGMQRTINGLLEDGYSVLTVYMPHFVQFGNVNDCGGSHDSMFNIALPTGSPMKFFLEPVAVCLNYLKTRSVADGFPSYQDFGMAGISGGGWTTTVYAAIDPTIKLSIPVAGTIPLYLRSGGSVGDTEQWLASFYQIAGYPDLYILGSYGPGRKQVQVLNRRDGCCFGEAQHSIAQTGMTYDQAMRDYEYRVRIALYNLGSVGFFRLEFDEAAPNHTISWNNLVNTILSEFNGGRRYIGASSSTDAFVRGLNGRLWHYGPGGWEETGFPMVGVAAVLQGHVNAFDVFYRDPSNRVMHAWSNGAGWMTEFIGGVIITDPAVIARAPGIFDIVAFGGDYRLYHWAGTVLGVGSFRLVNGGIMGLGSPTLVGRGQNQFDIFFRGFDRGLYHISSTGGQVPWPWEAIGGIMLDFPSAVAPQDGSLRAYIRGQSSRLWEAARVNGGPWQWSSVSDLTGGQLMRGSPSASVQGNAVRVHTRTTADNLSVFTLLGNWSFTNNGVGQFITGSPTSTPGGAFVRGLNGGLWLFDGTNWHGQGGIFD